MPLFSKRIDPRMLDTMRKTAAEFHATFIGNGHGTFVIDYLKRHYVERPSFDVTRPDEKTTLYREGERGVVLAMLRWIDWHENPEKLEQMLKQNEGVKHE